MRILWFVDILFDVNLDRVTWIEMVRVLQRNHDVHIISRYRKNKIQVGALKNRIQYIDSSGIPFVNRFIIYWKQARSFEDFIQKLNPDVVVFDSNNFFLLKKAARLEKKYGYKTVLDVRTIPVSAYKVKYKMESYLFRKSLEFASRELHGISYITREMREYCGKEFDLEEHCSGAWTSGVDIHHFTPRERKEEKKTFTLIYHGNITLNRGLDHLIRAAVLLEKDNIRIELLGSGNGLEDLKNLASRLGLERQVIFKPPVPYSQVPDHIQKADVGVLPFPDWPGWNTSSPIKLFEYLSCAKPVVATRIPAHLNVLQGREFVFWAEKSDPEELARAIRKAYEKREEFGKITKKAREFVKVHYTWKKQAKRLETFLKELA